MKNIKNPLSVLQLVYLTHDGITAMVFNICEFLDRERVNFDYLAFHTGEEYAHKTIRRLGGKAVIVASDRIKNPFLRSFFKYRGICREVRKNRETIVHVNASTPYDILIGLAARAGGAKRIFWHSHNSRGDRRPRRDIFIPLCRLLIPLIATDYLACSDEAAKYMLPKKIYREKKFQIIHNGIDLEKYEFNESGRRMIRRELELENCLVFGNIGRFHPQKNHKFLLEIFREIKKLRADAKLLLLGDGELLEQTKRQAAELSVEKDVIFYGTTTRVPEMLWAMDVYVMPSLYEGLPVTGVEAQASGLPMLVSDTVSPELAMTELVRYMPLQASAKDWAQKAAALSETVRTVHSEALRGAGYDVREIAGRLEEIYEGKA